MDYSFETRVSRDEVAGQLCENMEQLAYVLAEVAIDVPPGSGNFDDMCDELPGLSEEQKTALLALAKGLVQALEGP